MENRTKICIKCNVEKSFDFFKEPDGHYRNKICDSCLDEYRTKLENGCKSCNNCNQVLSLEAFRYKISKTTHVRYYDGYCKKCSNKRAAINNKKRYYAQKEKIQTAMRENYQNNRDAICKKNRLAYNHKSKEWHEKNRIRNKLNSQACRAKFPEKHLLNSAAQRAKKENLEFNLEISDIIIPEYCPVLGIKLYWGNRHSRENSPSIDRFDNTKGYIKGNIRIISWRANRIKSDASLEELKRIVYYMSQPIS